MLALLVAIALACTPERVIDAGTLELAGTRAEDAQSQPALPAACQRA
jgi:hypothetical protein